MSDIVIAIWAIAFLVALLGCIPYGIWMIYTAVKKRWKRLGLQVAVPLAAFLVLMGVSWIVNELAHERYLEGLYDTRVDLGTPIFEYDSERAFNGDGYSISVYELPPPIRARFASADARLLSDFPKRPSYRDHWSFERWRRSPFDDKFQKYLDFALSSYDADRASGLSEQFDYIRKALSGDRAYYAFFYYSHGDYPGNIDLFIVDLEGNRLYSINHNT
jgi:hypothetical protein